MRRPTGIYKRGRVYWITYTLNGRQRFESSKSSQLDVAKKLLRERQTEIDEGRRECSPSEAPFFSQAIRTYIEQKLNANTRKRYELAGRILVKNIGDFRISRLKAFHFDEFKKVRIAAGVSPAGVNRELAVARASLNLAVTRKSITYSPFSGVKLFNEEEYRVPPRAISFADETRILSCCDLRLRTLVLVLLETGQRVGVEALASRWSNIDFKEGTIYVPKSKTSAGRRFIPMTAICRSVLSQWHDITRGQSEYVFFNSQNPKTHIRSVKTAWHNALRAAGVGPIPIYTCRATFSTRLSAAGVPDALVDQLLGHVRKDVLRFYSARVTEFHRDAIHKLEKFRASKQSDLNEWNIQESRHITKGSNLIQ
jgi:integrase